jgi:hypothetical protein
VYGTETSNASRIRGLTRPRGGTVMKIREQDHPVIWPCLVERPLPVDGTVILTLVKVEGEDRDANGRDDHLRLSFVGSRVRHLGDAGDCPVVCRDTMRLAERHVGRLLDDGPRYDAIPLRAYGDDDGGRAA